MIAAPFKVVLDANVLFPFTLRDTLLRAAAEGFFQLYWSEDILDETTRNLVAKGSIADEQAQRLRSAMTRAFPASLVSGYEGLIDAMPNQEKDRHVAAVAVKTGAQVIVTCNLRDFRVLPDGVEAQSPDEFLANLLDLDPDGMAEVVRQQAAALQNPPRSMVEVLQGLAKVAPEFAANIAEHAGLAL